jgi:hypothetical protein
MSAMWPPAEFDLIIANKIVRQQVGDFFSNSTQTAQFPRENRAKMNNPFINHKAARVPAAQCRQRHKV